MTYFVPLNPGTGEHSTYTRSDPLFAFHASPITWDWRFDTGYAPTTWPLVRMTVDLVPVTDWVAAVSGVYKFTFDCANGSHLAKPEVEASAGQIDVCAKSFICNTSGQRLDITDVWAAGNRFEKTYGEATLTPVRVAYPGSLPTPRIYPFKPRTFEPWTETLTGNNMWVRRLQAHCSHGNVRRWVDTPDGITIEAEQKYYYSDVTDNSLEPPTKTLRDGPRGVGTLGYLFKFIMNPSDLGAYFMDTNGRLGFMWDDGRVTTFAGWRLKAGELKAHRSLRQTDKAFYDSKWEFVGDWSLVSDPRRFREPWGFAAFGGHHEFWVCDTLNHRILYANHWTAHPPTNYQMPVHPPLGYTPPAAPLGQTQMVPFPVPQSFTNEPWDCAIHEDKLYWTNFAGNSICRANLDGSNPEVVIQCSRNPTDAQLGIARRLDYGAPTSQLRALYHIDGPIGTATCVRPQGIAFDSLGRLTWVERYTYLIRRLENGTVSTVYTFGTPGNAFGVFDISLAIDDKGTAGEKDDILVNLFNNSMLRFSTDGVRRGGIIPSPQQWLQNGRGDTLRYPNYGWAIGIGNGRIWVDGSAGAWQFSEISKRKATDVEPSPYNLYQGDLAYQRSLLRITHGPQGQGELGLPYIDELGTWSDAALTQLARDNEVPETDIPNLIAWIRFQNVEADYSVPGAILQTPASLSVSKVSH